MTVDTHRRRLYLRVAIKALLGVATLLSVYVLMSAFFGSNSGSVRHQSQRVATGHLAAGEILFMVWEGRPVMIHRRTSQQVLALDTSDPRLADPESARAEQPDWVSGNHRSRAPGWFVAIGVGTDFSCPISFLPASDEVFQSEEWQDGFVDSCRGSRYDLAGRVYANQYAEHNLIVPEYVLTDDAVILGQ